MKKRNQILIYLFAIVGVLSALTYSCKKSDDTNPPAGNTVTDIDGNVYHTVTLGTQVWLVENLKSKRYKNGDTLTYIKFGKSSNIQQAGGFANYNNDTANSSTYGRLYNWYAVIDPRGLAPTGWHVPTDTEWFTLTTYLGTDVTSISGKLKETGFIHWLTPNTGATNETGFTALPGGYRAYTGAFKDLGNYGMWWSTTELNTTSAWGRSMYFGNTSVGRGPDQKNSEFSVRCVKD
jgi:uncharacterized protein (TIGR02145 family)